MNNSLRYARHAAAPMILAATLALGGCGRGQEPAAQAESAPVPVSSVEVKAEALQLISELPGRIEPLRVAEVRARVAGIVLSRDFTEGADVKAGQVLFRIDPAPFRAALARAQGELARADAALHDARVVVGRYEPLVGIEAVSQQEYDTAVTTLRSAEAARRSASADVDTAQLNLDYATVRAPISGRIGRALVTEGALVGQNETTALATIQQIDRVYADFKQPVASVLRMKEALTKGELLQDKDGGARISLTVEGSERPREGRLLFSDISVDRQTGQVSLRGQFDNPDGVLLPGMYVRVRTQHGISRSAVSVPQRAVHQAADASPQVLVIDGEGRAQARAVRTGEMTGAHWQILDGLKPGERVIVSGKASPGMAVRETEARPADVALAAGESGN